MVDQNKLTKNYFANVSCATLNQWAMDFEWNKNNIIQSIKIAKQNNCTIRLGPELEVPGYSCEDHFLELDTTTHSWEVLGEILDSDLTNDILCDIGMPVLFKNALYNCRVICLNRKIILIRPKIWLAEGGNYRELRFFSNWEGKEFIIEDFELPLDIVRITGQKIVPFGNAIIQCRDTAIGIESCQELWMPQTLSTQMGFDGVEIFLNASASHHEILKQRRKIDLIKEVTKKAGGIYMYSNLRGCDGSRLYFDGTSMIMQNGKLVDLCEMFSLDDVEVMCCCVDLQEVQTQRAQDKSWGMQAKQNKKFPKVYADIEIARVNYKQAQIKYFDEENIKDKVEDQISLGPSCYLWDYLRRSGGMGYFLALSGGADSASVALMVYHMCELVYKKIVGKQIQNNVNCVLEDLQRILKEEKYYPQNPQEICSKILYTGYMASSNSSQETRKRASNLSKEISSTHFELSIQDLVKVYNEIASSTFKKQPRYIKEGGTFAEDLALQNVQARSRMILAYYMGQLIPWHLNKNGFLLVLGASNLDEGLRGYFTKYDCSSADINPIGSLNKNDIKSFLKWNYEQKGFKTAKEILEAAPTAELRPLDDNKKIVQTDEDDMGMSYDELSVYGRLRKVQSQGPVSMFKQLVQMWKHLKPKTVADKVKHFFKTYSCNRHKQTTLTPAVHMENYSIDDNRFDLRQFLYNINWPFQFKKIDQLVKLSENEAEQQNQKF